MRKIQELCGYLLAAGVVWLIACWGLCVYCK
jgi:hypothetical protein